MLHQSKGLMSSASKTAIPDLFSAANEETIRFFQETEHVCQRLKDKKFTDPALTLSIHQLASICEITIQECSKVAPYNQMSSQRRGRCESLTSARLTSQGQPPLLGPSIQDTSRLKDLIDECHRRTADVVALLDKALTHTTEEHRLKTACHQQQKKHLDNISDTLDSLMKEGASNIWPGRTPHARVKRHRLRQHAETILLPAIRSFVDDLVTTYNSEDGSRDNILFTGGNQMERQTNSKFNTCLELTSHWASSFLAQTNPLYIHTYATTDQVPYKRDTEVPTASGSFGIVYKGVDVKTGTARAIKQLKKIYSGKKRSEVLRELSMLERCDHPNIIRLLDAYQIGDDPSTVFLVTEPWAPYTLSSFIHDNDSQRRAACPWFAQDSPLTEKHILRIFDGLAAGLAYLHSKSIKHKDIKPENILLYCAGRETIQPIIADLGISKIFDVDASTDYNKSTYTYLAPEQIDCVESTLKADVWQMGCCFALILAVFRASSAGCRQLWTSFENSDGDCSCNIAKESLSFMKSLKKICGSGTPSQCHAHWIITAMLETTPTARFDIKAVRRELSELLSTT